MAPEWVSEAGGRRPLLPAGCVLGPEARRPAGAAEPSPVCGLLGLLGAPALGQPEAREQGVGPTGSLVAFPNMTIARGRVRAGLLSRPAHPLPPPCPRPFVPAAVQVEARGTGFCLAVGSDGRSWRLVMCF